MKKIKVTNKYGNSYEVETNTGVFLKYTYLEDTGLSEVQLINGDTISKVAESTKQGNLSVFARELSCDRIEFLDLDDKYTVLFDEEGLFINGNPLYLINYKGNAISWIPGDFIVAAMDRNGDAMSLSKEDVKELLLKLNPVRQTFV